VSERDTQRARERRESGLTPAGLPAEPDGPVRPPRPVGVEVASAVMIVTGVMSALMTIEATWAMANRGEATAPIAALSMALGIGSVILGFLVRSGRAWLVAVNVLAVAGFLELTSGTAPGFLFGGLDVIVVVLLMRDRPWFAWSPDHPAGDDEDDEDDT
jgi:hypothetical protein